MDVSQDVENTGDRQKREHRGAEESVERKIGHTHSP